MITYLYETNAENMEKFFKTEDYKKLKKGFKESKNAEVFLKDGENFWFQMIKNAINNGYFKDGMKIYKDPDNSLDFPLFEKINEYYNNEYKCVVVSVAGEKSKLKLKKGDIYFSLDCVIGWKAIWDANREFLTHMLDMDPYDINYEKIFISDYKCIRNPENAGHLLWPVHSMPTINTERYQKFNDRIDYTLFDIKNYFDPNFDNEKLKLKAAYNQPQTKKWLESFESFKDFIDKMKLNRWCDEDYNIYDITSEVLEDRIEKYLCDDEDYNAQEIYFMDVHDIGNIEKIITKEIDNNGNN